MGAVVVQRGGLGPRVGCAKCRPTEMAAMCGAVGGMCALCGVVGVCNCKGANR